jgi:hypothetical protein
MSKEKNKNTFRIGALLLVACLISSVMLSGTFAKYTSEYAGQDTALVASWSLDIKDGANNGFALSPADPVDLDLFLHEYDNNILATADDQKIIAPGVSGKFVLNIANNSDVAAEIDFDISEDEDGPDIPMEFGIGEDFDFDTHGATIYEDVDDLTYALNVLNGGIKLTASDGAPNNTESVTVHWRWKFERGADQGQIDTNDASDTNLGKASYTAYTGAGAARIGYILTVKVKATQLEPGTV